MTLADLINELNSLPDSALTADVECDITNASGELLSVRYEHGVVQLRIVTEPAEDAD